MLGVRKNPRNELGRRFPGQALRHARMMNANRKQSGERT